MVYNRIFVKTPFGTLSVIEKDGAINRIERCKECNGEERPSLVLMEAKSQIEQYFCGKRRSFDLALLLEGSAFDVAVWNALMEIPFGTTVSYGEIARRIGKPSASRAVGGVVGRNPILIVIPCHRVIRSDGGLGGFSAGLDAKKILLHTEGVCHFGLDD